MDNQEFCLLLAKCESESEVIDVLCKFNLWNDQKVWRDFGDDENNFATIGNQQSFPETALVEKIINSVDAVLMSECLINKINPESNQAPQSINEALELYFKIRDGKLSNISPTERTNLADKINLIVSGQKSNPSYTITDFGEGQTPDRMPETLLSLRKSNKLRIPFVQGRFNMGGTGVFRFCGKNNIQLIISKRHPKIIKIENSSNDWGFTIVRRENPRDKIRNSIYKYLAPNNKILRFSAESLPLMPSKYPNPYGNEFKWGTFIKLFNYQITGYKTNIILDLYYRLSLLIPTIALPIRLYERRKGYSAHSYETNLHGLSVRLDEDKKKNLEEGFPSSHRMTIHGFNMNVSIYVFKKGESDTYTKNEGIIFTINGQTHGAISKNFFNRRNVGLGNLANSILVIIDCTNFGSSREREDLFMNSRDRLASGELKNEIENNLEELLKNHQGLRDLKEKRRREEISEQLKDSKPFAEILENIIKKSPTLSLLFSGGNILSNPFKIESASKSDNFVGKKFPTFFKLIQEFPKEKPKTCCIKHKFRIQFETDAQNDYFARDNDPGSFFLKINNDEVKDFSINLWNGIATLIVKLPNDANIDNIIEYNSCITDISRIDGFCEKFFINIINEIESNGTSKGKRKPPSSKDKGNDAFKNSLLGLPNIIEVREPEKELHNFEKDSALKVVNIGDKEYDFFVYMDNIHVKREIKYNIEDLKLIEARYKFGISLIGLSLIYDDIQSKKSKEDEENLYTLISDTTKAITPILLPMIDILGALKIDEINKAFDDLS